jgi:hypothetical protein
MYQQQQQQQQSPCNNMHNHRTRINFHKGDSEYVMQ